MAVLLLLGHFAPSMPPFAVSLFWAALSALSAIGLAYYAVMKKTHNRFKYQEGGMLHRINEGRTFSLVVRFVVAAACMTGLMLEAAKWGVAEWVFVVAAIPAYALVFLLVQHRLGKEYERAFLAASTVKWSCIIVCVLLCAAYAVFALAQPAASYDSAANAFLSAQQPFENSPSKLMSEVGMLASLVDGLTAYGMSQAAHLSYPIYVIFRIVLVASAFFSVANLLGVCSLETKEIKRVFAPLASLQEAGAAVTETEPNPSCKTASTSDAENASEAEPSSDAEQAKPSYPPSDKRDASARLNKKYVAIAAALPVCLVVAFMGANFAVEKAAETEEFSAAESFVRDQAGMAAFVLDDTYYDYQAVEHLMSDVQAKSDELYSNAQETLVPLINESYDARVANVDKYLDWYYSLPADYERLARTITGTAESFVEEQFQNAIEDGIDDSQLENEFDAFFQQAEQLKADAEAQLEAYRLDDVPGWLVTTTEVLDTDFLAQPMEPAQKLLDAGQRLGINAAAGVAGGVLAKQLVSKAIGKQFCSKVVTKLTTAAASRAASGAVGGAVGTLAGPLGTAASSGLSLRAAMGVGVDYVLLNIDEMQNRETYKQEIIDTIEEERAEKLALVG